MLKFTKKQIIAAAILSSKNYTRCLIYGGSRSGKSVTIAHKLHLRAIEFPGLRQVIFRKTLVDAKEKFWKETMLPILESDRGLCKIYKHPTVAVYRNGSEIRVAGLHPSEIDKALGAEYGTIFINEASEVSWQNIPVLLTRLSAMNKNAQGEHVIPKLFLDCNPPTAKHWIYSAFIKKVHPVTNEPLPDKDKWVAFRMNPQDNMENLSQDFLESLAAMSERDKKRFLFGEFATTEGLVYDCFDYEKHIFDDDNLPDAPTYCGIDFGFVNPFVCLWAKMLSDDTFLVYREYYKRGITTDVHALKIQELSRGERIEAFFADHEAGERAILAKNGIQTKPADKDLKKGINIVYSLFEKNKIKIHRSCKNLIDELNSYAWKESTTKDEPRKENDHACDALRYLILGALQKSNVSVFEVNWL